VGEGAVTIASPHLFILRPKSGYLAFPGYLTWYLNLPETQEQIRAIRRGTGVPFVPMAPFAELLIPVPSIDVQHNIMGLHRLAVQEQALMQQIREQRRRFTDAVMLEAVRREGAGEPGAGHAPVEG
jgi:hypothetical protein